jgi:hypothetical protein
MNYLLIIFFLFMPVISHAAPEVILTWKATSYVPENYKGKALPVAGTPIDVSVILVDGGKVISLTPYDINWYAGEDRIAGGKGTIKVRTVTPITGQESLELRVNISKYKDQPLDAFITIPVVRPEILILKKANAQKQDFSVIPYFWNIMKPSELTITWEDGGDNVIAHATNKKNEMEFAQITIPKQ